MVSDYIQLSWNSDSNEELSAGCYIEYNGERYSLLEPYKPTQKNEAEYTYTPQFQSKVMAWGKVPFFFYTTNEGKTTKEPDWTLTSNPADFLKCVCDSLKNEINEDWTYVIDASLPSSVSLSFSTTDIFSALNEIAGAFETEWYADKVNNVLYLGKASFGESVTLEVGKNINIPSVNSTREGYYTRFYAFGSTRNITQKYEGSNVNNLVNKRLTLDPVKFPNGYKDIKEGLSEGEIFSKVLVFDDVYPSSKLSISNVRNRLMYRVDGNSNKVQVGTDDKGNPIYDQYAIWYFRINGFDFDVKSIIEGKTLSVHFNTGALSGREFELKYYDSPQTITTSDGLTFEAKKGDYEIQFVEESNYIIPSLTGLVPSEGDEVILFNIEMPTEYTQSAYNELESALDKEIQRLTSNLNNYTFNSNPVAFDENNPNLSIGRNVTYKNGNETLNTRVIKLTTHLDFPIEQNITIGNEKIKGNTQQLKEEVATANKDLNLLAVFNDMSSSLQQSYVRTQQMMLDGFAAIKNIWQIKEDDNGKKYIYSAYNVATEGGVSMYRNLGFSNIPSIYNGLPIDWKTIIWDENGDLKAVVKSGLDEEQLRQYLTDNDYTTEDWVKQYVVDVNSGTITAITKPMVIDALGYTPYDESNPKGYITNSALSGYATTSSVNTALSGKVDKVSGKGLSTEDFTTALKTKLEGLNNYNDTAINNAINQLRNDFDTLVDGDASTAIDTFNEIIAFLDGVQDNQDLASIIASIEQQIAAKYTKPSGGIPKSDLAQSVQTSLGKADSALQSETDPIFSASAAAGIKASDITNWNSKTSNVGTITEIKMNGASKGKSGVVDLGTVITAHQDISGKADKSSLSTVATSGDYRDLINKPVIPIVPSSLKNPNALKFGNKSYDGSSEQTITASDLGALTSHQDISGKLDKTEAESTYLPLSGGNISGNLNIGGLLNAGTNMYLTGWLSSQNHYLFVKDNADADWIVTNQNWSKEYKLIHEGNYSSYALPLSGGTMAGNIILPIGYNLRDANSNTLLGTDNNSNFKLGSTSWALNLRSNGTQTINGNTLIHSGNIGSQSVASATKLATPRTLWGQSFDGSGNVDGSIYFRQGQAVLYAKVSGIDGNLLFLQVNPEGHVLLGQQLAKNGKDALIYGNNIKLCYGTAGSTSNTALTVNSSGNVGIGTTSPASKLHVNGNLTLGYNKIYIGDGSNDYFLGWGNGNLYEYHNYYGHYFVTQTGEAMRINNAGNVGIGTNSPSAKLHVDGNILTTGGITMYSMRSLKDVVDEEGLTLDQLKTIKPTRYTWKDKRDERIHIGGIADDVQKVLPEVIYKTSDGVLTMDYGNAAFAVATSLIKPVSEQEERIAELEKENKELRAELDEMRLQLNMIMQKLM